MSKSKERGILVRLEFDSRQVLDTWRRLETQVLDALHDLHGTVHRRTEGLSRELLVELDDLELEAGPFTVVVEHVDPDEVLPEAEEVPPAAE